MRRKVSKRATEILQCLNATELDDSVIGGLLRIKGLRKVLASVLAGEVEASAYQIKNAVHVLGRLKEPEAIPHLLSALKTGDLPVRLHVPAALYRIGPDARAVAALKAIVRDAKADPAEIAYALRALERSSDRSLITDLKDKPPAHVEDPGVLESLAHLRATLRHPHARAE